MKKRARLTLRPILSLWQTLRRPQSISGFAEKKESNLIQLECLRRMADFFIKFLTEPGDLVFDPFGGSDTTGSSNFKSKKKVAHSRAQCKLHKWVERKIIRTARKMTMSRVLVTSESAWYRELQTIAYYNERIRVLHRDSCGQSISRSLRFPYQRRHTHSHQSPRLGNDQKRF